MVKGLVIYPSGKIRIEEYEQCDDLVTYELNGKLLGLNLSYQHDSQMKTNLIGFRILQKYTPKLIGDLFEKDDMRGIVFLATDIDEILISDAQLKLINEEKKE